MLSIFILLKLLIIRIKKPLEMIILNNNRNEILIVFSIVNCLINTLIIVNFLKNLCLIIIHCFLFQVSLNFTSCNKKNQVSSPRYCKQRFLGVEVGVVSEYKPSSTGSSICSAPNGLESHRISNRISKIHLAIQQALIQSSNCEVNSFL